MPPVHVEVEKTLSHPVAAVFRFMADPVNRPRWQEHTQQVEMLTEGPAGSRHPLERDHDGPRDVRGRGRRLRARAPVGGGGGHQPRGGRISVAFAPEGDAATRVTVTVEIHLRGMRRMMGAAVAPMISRQLPRDLERLDALLDETG